ncbi:hypothetical protein [uncultured Oxalicibacterium sp.]|uniref:hypothetical protein n=1 Tax=uncultured Oxalicibacterium sp. TaxID=1168540 RepID=UPI0025FE6FDD|nr:hypothetical protein [uncultured Oxalicibacterium sp.]
MSRLIPFNTRSLGLSKKINKALIEAHRALCGHQAKTTQAQTWRCLRKLALCMVQNGLAHTDALPKNIVSIFYDWLAPQVLCGSTKQSLFNSVRSVISWVSRNRSNAIDGPLTLDVRSFPRQPPARRAEIDEKTAEKILNCALSDIENIEKRLQVASVELTDLTNPKTKLVNRLLELGQGNFPTQRAIGTSGESLARRVLEAGGLRELSRYVFLSNEDLLPFYLAIQLQIAGNPHSTADLRRNCIEANPLRDDREWIAWEKPRAKKFQRVDFPAKKWNSAPSLVRRLKALNERLVPRAGDFKDRLFIACSNGRVVKIPSAQSWHNYLTNFIKVHELPDFDFVDLRKTNARLHHQAGGSILAAKNRLNHKSVATTANYTSLNDRAFDHNKFIAQSQAALNELVLASTLATASSPEMSSVSAQTVFGFLCSNPFNGYGDSHGSKGPCDHFFRCATCPGALVPLDDPSIVSKLLAARDHLLSSKDAFINQGRLPRFRMLYQPTLDAIEQKLLPFVASEVMKVAQQIKKQWAFPELE